MTSWLAHYGVAAVFGLMLIDAVFPAASEAVMVYGGALASGALTHRVDVLGWHATGLGAYIAVVLAGVLGYQVGAIGGWWIGDYGGRPFLERHGRLFHLSPAQLDRAERWFDRWDDRAVLLGRITPVARSFISIPAGVFEMPFPRYNVLTFVGNAVWCLALAGVGWALGTSYSRFDHGFRYVEIAVVVGIAVAVGYWVLRRRRTATISSGHGDTPR
ncbi:MAG TPA: DedA family protein [Gaiellaceae bacterium]